jgi:hypothetical protein
MLMAAIQDMHCENAVGLLKVGSILPGPAALRVPMFSDQKVRPNSGNIW